MLHFTDDVKQNSIQVNITDTDRLKNALIGPDIDL